MKLNASEVKLKTAQVEIKALTVSGKQVTLAVFRQLEEKELVDYNTNQLNGIVWGKINYHPNKCAHDAEHLHLIWQSGDSIFRGAVYRQIESSDEQDCLEQQIENLKELFYLVKTLKKADWRNNRDFRFESKFIFRGNRYEVSEYIRNEINKVRWTLSDIHTYQNERGEWAVEKFEAAKKKLPIQIKSIEQAINNLYKQTWKECGKPFNDLNFFDVLDSTEKKLADHLATRNQLYETLSSVEHLFIAL